MEIKLGDKVRVGNAGGIYSRYAGMADMMGLTGYRVEKYPEHFIFDVVAIAKHPEAEDDYVYALKNEDGEFLFNGRLGDMKVVNSKPTRTEYVKVIDSIFDLKAEFEAGELYHEILGSSELVVIDDEPALIYELQHGNVYRKVERAITWQNELKSHCQKKGVNVTVDKGNNLICTGWIGGSQFIEMSHKVYNLTK